MGKTNFYSHQIVKMPKLILLLGMVQVSLMLASHILVYKRTLLT